LPALTNAPPDAEMVPPDMDWILYTILALAAFGCILALLALLALRKQQSSQGQSHDGLTRLDARLDEQGKGFSGLRQEIGLFTEKQGAASENFKVSFQQLQLDALQKLQTTLQSGHESSSRQMTDALAKSAEELGKRVEYLTTKTDQRLQEISGQVEKRLTDGFEKTTATFQDVQKRLIQIDEAQKKIAELSNNVVSLQHVLSDKKSRGAFGEVQLSGLVHNSLPESAFHMQHTLESGNRADCILFLPPPTGNIVIDAKFPLENYQQMIDLSAPEAQRKEAEKRFKTDIRKHIGDIASKYIVPGETSDGAIMFLPAESIFAEIHAYHRDLVEEAQRARVWISSPTTLMAILTTVRAVLKDAAMREHIHIMQAHLNTLGKDFGRFKDRMESLVNHVRKANEQVDQVETTAGKLTDRFRKIEQVDLQVNGTALPMVPVQDLE
jgi:DNA recombination protein RmuC